MYLLTLNKNNLGKTLILSPLSSLPAPDSHAAHPVPRWPQHLAVVAPSLSHAAHSAPRRPQHPAVASPSLSLGATALGQPFLPSNPSPNPSILPQIKDHQFYPRFKDHRGHFTCHHRWLKCQSHRGRLSNAQIIRFIYNYRYQIS